MSPNYQEFLGGIPLFNSLPPEMVAELAQKVVPFRYRMGQPIAQYGQLSSQVAIVYQGQARLLGDHPQNPMAMTLGLLQPGAVIGGVSAVRGVPCETAIASTELICLTLTNQEFLALLDHAPAFYEAFCDRTSPVETFDLLGGYFGQQAKFQGDLKEIVDNAWMQGEVYYLGPGVYGADTAEWVDLQRSGKTWFVSGGGEVLQRERSDRLGFEPGTMITVNGDRAVRLVGFPPSILAPIAPVTPPTPNPTAAIAPLPDPFDEEPTTPAPEETVPYAPVEVMGLQGGPRRHSGPQDYPFIKAKGEEGMAIACFQMLTQYYKMRFKGDIIQRIVKDQIQRYGALSLPNCGLITELMGLNAQLLKVPTKTLTRLPVPLLTKWRGSLALIYDVNDKNVTVAVPDLGLVHPSPQDFIEGWGDDNAMAEILTIQKGKYTPEKRFGLSWFIPAIKKYKWVLIEVLVASFLVQIFALANPLIIQQIIDKVIVQKSGDALQVYGILLLILASFEGLLGTLRTYLFADTTNRIDLSLGSEIIDHLFRLPLQYFEKRSVGEISTRIGELEQIRQFLTGTALSVILDAVFSVVYVVVMFYYHGKLAAVALSVIPVFVVATFIFSPIIRRQLREKAEKNAQSQSYLVEVMTGVQTVKAQNIELRSRWKWQEKYARYVSAGFNTVITSTASSSVSNFLNKLSGLLVLWYGAALVLEGPEVLTLGQLIAFRIIAGYVTSPILRLTQLWQNFQETSISLERLADVVDHPQEGEEDRDNIPIPLIQGAVTYEDVSFRFKKQGPLNLDNVNLHFPAGTFVAVVGQSGAGKSTLTKLLSRLYEPESGRILIDGYDVNKVELYSLRQQVGVVPQETLLFEGTVQDNIALTNPEADPEEIEQAARVAVAHDFIMESLPNGYNTQVGERGAALSGGQKQRIAIARSVLQRPRILVLDEATSALDYLTERQVCQNLKAAFDETTVFFITHRLDTIKDADVVVLMHEGHVEEQGTHDELMAMRGRYYSLYQQQARSPS